MKYFMMLRFRRQSGWSWWAMTFLVIFFLMFLTFCAGEMDQRPPKTSCIYNTILNSLGVDSFVISSNLTVSDMAQLYDALNSRTLQGPKPAERDNSDRNSCPSTELEVLKLD